MYIHTAMVSYWAQSTVFSVCGTTLALPLLLVVSGLRCCPALVVATVPLGCVQTRLQSLVIHCVCHGDGGLSPLVLPTCDNWLFIGAVPLAVAHVAVVSVVSLPLNGPWFEQFLRQNVAATFEARTPDTFRCPPSELIATGAYVLAFLGLQLTRNGVIVCLAFPALRDGPVHGHFIPPLALALDTSEVATFSLLGSFIMLLQFLHSQCGLPGTSTFCHLWELLDSKLSTLLSDFLQGEQIPPALVPNSFCCLAE